jgi:hypothetical protein
MIQEHPLRPERLEPRGSRAELFRILAALIVFGVAFGLVEAAVVIDLRAIYEPIHRSLHPSVPAGELFPLLTVDDLRRGPDGSMRLLAIEVAREAATIALLAGFALSVGGRPLRMFAAFVAAFGVWDLVFYAALKLLIGWPESFRTWDVLFLIPLPWTGPVIAPVVVALTMVACGVHTIARDAAGTPISLTWRNRLGVVGGGLMIFLAFSANWRGAVSGVVPETFPWAMFSFGEGLAVLAYLMSTRAPELAQTQPDLGGPGCGS